LSRARRAWGAGGRVKGVYVVGMIWREVAEGYEEGAGQHVPWWVYQEVGRLRDEGIWKEGQVGEVVGVYVERT